jgi:hypothetical protein
LQKNKDQLALLRKASSESKNGMNEKLKGFKNMKKQLLQDQGKVMDDLNDRNVSPGPVSLVGGGEGSWSRGCAGVYRASRIGTLKGERQVGVAFTWLACQTHIDSNSRPSKRSFKLDNRLKEAEPKIKRITDYETVIDKFTENQTAWWVVIFFLLRIFGTLI